MAISQRLVDPSREIRVPASYSWQDAYQAALLETDWTKMVELVQAAESEIHKRRLELSKDHNGTQQEREAVVNAMSGLGVLRMNVASWLERQNLGGTFVRKPVQHEPHPFRPTFGFSPDKASQTDTLVQYVTTV